MMDNTIIFRVYCVSCTSDTSQLYVKCSECGDMKLCLTCFSKGAEPRSHLKSHDYKIIDNGTFSLHDPNWSAVEEQLLIDSVEQFGLGNWEDVASNVSTKTAKEVEEHYMSVYMDSYMGRMVVPTEIPNRMTDHTPSIHESTPILPPPNLQVSKVEQLELAYMPNRDDFEYEFDNDAERLISPIFMNTDDNELDRGLKLAKVDMYLTRLRERQRRKDISREYYLVDKFFAKDGDELKSENELLQRLKSCSQFMKSDQFKQLVQDIEREQYLKQKVKRLQNYRRNGLTKFEGCDFYDSERHKRLKQGKESKSHSKLPPEPESEKQFSSLMTSQGFSLLCHSEKLLCNSLRISPSKYITSKALILKDNMLKQHGCPNKHKFSSYIEKVHRRKISSFLRSKGWLS
uniref:transcriptional adapter 2-beta isoform X1 n=1 Tax=Ciona intestinalis TaxID=7719 RepID=UPI0000522B00|nr:transcriptional adapter 2-beta isoform X1 [Ciona intestinalis]|eukprot:XP_009858022.1 transcriptional adapter 2-beta isoform X1 [Ciona intestinalis]